MQPSNGIYQNRICKFCGKVFTPLNTNTFYCSVTCNFWSKVDKRSDDECWNWLGAKSKDNGYGILRIDHHGVKAHQLSWVIHFGEIPQTEETLQTYHGTCVLHKCDNKSCCNPSHLYLGTQADNVHDVFARDRRRSYIGTDNPASVLTAVQVKEIRIMTSLNMASRAIAAYFGIGQTTVLRIRNKETYADV